MFPNILITFYETNTNTRNPPPENVDFNASQNNLGNSLIGEEILLQKYRTNKGCSANFSVRSQHESCHFF